MNQNKFSCIIATHNRDEYLKEAIQSIINQTYPPFEIIISDNVPNKSTELIVQAFSKENSIPIIYIGHNLGGKGCISRNLAVSKSSGDYIAFLDDDDLWDKDYLKKMSDFIFKKKSKIFYAWLIDLYNDYKKPGKKLQPNVPISTFLYKNPGSVISNLIVKREVFVCLGGFDEYIHPSYDKDFLIRAIHFGFRYDVLNESLVYFRKSNHNKESEIKKNFLIGMKKLFKKHEFHADLFTKLKFWTKYYWYFIIIIINGIKSKS